MMIIVANSIFSTFVAKPSSKVEKGGEEVPGREHKQK